MIPLRDNVPSRSTPVVNYALIAACALAFIGQLTTPTGRPSLVERYGMIPARVVHPDEPVVIKDAERVQTREGVKLRVTERPAAPAGVPAVLTLATCIFLHGGWMHFLGNMWFLFIFGDNVEDRFGHVAYLIFYLVAGVAASASHLLSAPGSSVPTIGASGAIAGVMGAYMLLYPKSKVLTLVPIIVIIRIMVLPAPLFLGIWFVLQLVPGLMSVSSTEATGVAWWAHIGGFVLGLGVAAALHAAHYLNPKVQETRPNTDRFTHSQYGMTRRK